MRLLTTALLFISSTAIACPNLAGKYVRCQSTLGSLGPNSVEVKQSVQNGVTVYTLTYNDEPESERSDTYTTDGKVRSDAFTQGSYEYKTYVVSTCDDKVLRFKSHTTIRALKETTETVMGADSNEIYRKGTALFLVANPLPPVGADNTVMCQRE